MKKVLLFGEIIWDVYPEEKCIGGAPFNFASHLTQLGVNSSLITAVGADEMGEWAKCELAQRHIEGFFSTAAEKYPTGYCLVTLDNKGKPNYELVQNVAYDHIEYSKEQLAELLGHDYDVFYFGTLAQRAAKSHNTLRNILETIPFREIFCDVNVRKPFCSLEAIRTCFEYASILKISREELPYIFEMLLIDEKYTGIPEMDMRAICRHFPKIHFLILTLDSDGAAVYDTVDNRCYFHSALKVDVVSTVGAGDSFGAAFLAAYLNEKMPSECLQAAIERSAYVVSHREAVPQ